MQSEKHIVYRILLSNIVQSMSSQARQPEFKWPVVLFISRVTLSSILDPWAPDPRWKTVPIIKPRHRLVVRTWWESPLEELSDWHIAKCLTNRSYCYIISQQQVGLSKCVNKPPICNLGLRAQTLELASFESRCYCLLADYIWATYATLLSLF